MYRCPYFCRVRCLEGSGRRQEKMTRYEDIINKYFRDNPPMKRFSETEALWIAEQLNIRFDKFDLEQFTIGLNVELEHGRINPNTNITDDDPILTGKITLAHLNEYPDYYKRLTNMEDEAEKYWDPKEDR